MQQEKQSQELGIVYFYVSGKQDTRILLATSSPTLILFSRNGTYYTQYIYYNLPRTESILSLVALYRHGLV